MRKDYEEESFARDVRRLGKATEMTLKLFSDIGSDFGKTIPEKMNEWGAFTNPAFLSFLFHFYRSCLFLFKNPSNRPEGDSYYSEDSLRAAYTTARFILMTVPYKGTKREEAERIIQEKETQIFLREFAETIPTMLFIEKDQTGSWEVPEEMAKI